MLGIQGRHENFSVSVIPTFSTSRMLATFLTSLSKRLLFCLSLRILPIRSVAFLLLWADRVMQWKILMLNEYVWASPGVWRGLVRHALEHYTGQEDHFNVVFQLSRQLLKMRHLGSPLGCVIQVFWFWEYDLGLTGITRHSITCLLMVEKNLSSSLSLLSSCQWLLRGQRHWNVSRAPTSLPTMFTFIG